MEKGLAAGTRGIFSSFALKRVAIISMIIDHFASVVMDGVIAPYRNGGLITFTADMPFMVRNAYVIDSVCDVLGSIAFPIFCFLLAEGFIHTRSRVKYAARVGIFALISEIPFDLAHYQKLWCFDLQNVMFTLCVSLFTLLAVSLIEEKYAGDKARRLVFTALAIVAGMGLAFLLRGEYVFLGVLTVSLLYLLRDAGYYRLLGFAPLLIVSPWILLALPFVFFYGGQRGRGSKYFFYVFYPAHFLLFAGIAYLLAGRAV